MGSHVKPCTIKMNCICKKYLMYRVLVSQLKNWRVGAVKVAMEGGSNPLSSKVTMATEPQPTSRQLSTQHRKPVSGMNTYPKNKCGREGGKEASKRCKANAHGNAPADLHGAPHIILEKTPHWLDFNFA